MKRLVALLLLTTIILSPQGAAKVKRPRILGVAHMALYVSDLQAARAFYKDFLGYAEPFALKREDGADRIAFIKINDDHIAFLTDSAEAMRDYLASGGIKVPDKVGKGRIGNSNFNILDPDGHTVEIVEYQPDSWTRREKGKFMPDTRISTRIAHLGVLVGAVDPAMKFYRDVLGFQEFWRGSSTGKVLSWINMRVPDGNDYLEFMLYATPQDAVQMGVKNHICLVVPDIKQAVAILESRPVRKNYNRPIEIKTGINGKRQANLFDPDGTRIELMEPNTADSKPVPSSTAPPPIR